MEKAKHHSMINNPFVNRIKLILVDLNFKFLQFILSILICHPFYLHKEYKTQSLYHIPIKLEHINNLLDKDMLAYL